MTAFELPTRGHVWAYPAVVVRWIDGDTVVVNVALSPKLAVHEEHVRLEGVNTPERNSSDPEIRRRAQDARELAESLAPVGSRVVVRCTRTEKYGRLLAQVSRAGGPDIGGALLDAGLAVPT